MFLKSKIISYIVAFLIIGLIVVFPDISCQGAIQGLLISSNVIVPSLFPFMVCILLIIKSEIKVQCQTFNRLIYKLFGQNFDMFLAFVFSMLGGYPIGARLINELYSKKIINEKTANIMITYCVNAGPAFIISVVSGSFYSKKLGIILLISHLLGSIIIALICARELKKENFNITLKTYVQKSFSQIFVESICDATSGIISICSFITIFSVINAYLDCFLNNLLLLKYLSLFTEVTAAATKCKNLYMVSFLLAFSCLSIWCQVFAMFGKIKLNAKRFVFGRIIHGTLSTIISYGIIKIFNIKITIFSNNINTNNKIFYSDITLFVSVTIMVMVFLIFIVSKNNSRKIINDVL